MGMMGDMYDGLKPKDLERFSLKVLSGDRERGGGGGGDNKSSTSGFGIKQCFVSHLIFITVPLHPESFLHFTLEVFNFNHRYLLFH